MAAKPKFEDKEVNDYYSGLSDDEFEEFATNLQADFDNTIIDTFDLTKAQQDALSKTDRRLKEMLASDLRHKAEMRPQYGPIELTFKGLDPTVPANPLFGLKIDCDLSSSPPYVKCRIEFTT